MGKSVRKGRGDKEFTELQRLKHENQKLRRENGRLQKVLGRIDVDRFNNLKELVNLHAKEAKAEEDEKSLERLKKKWTCYECGKGYLRLVIFPKWDGDYYYRKCSNVYCGHRTKAQRYSDKVEGIKEE